MRARPGLSVRPPVRKDVLVTWRTMRHMAIVLTGLLLVSSLTGCVYYRLYKLKAQLSNFERNFAIDHSGRPAVLFKKPILKESDVEWLTGLSPSVRQASDIGITNVYHFTKVIPVSTVPKAYHELIYTFEYEQELLSRITFPVQFSGFLTTTNFVEMLSPIRNAKTDHDDTKTEWSWREMYIQIPSYERICHYLGTPSQVASNPVSRDPFFRYTLKGQEADSRFDFPLRMDYRVWNYNNRMYDVTCNVGRLFVYIDVSKEDKVVKMDIKK